MVTKKLLTISKDETAALQAISREKFILDRQSDLIRAKREGIKEGEQKGKQKGIKEIMKEIAKNLLKLGLNFYKVSHITGLSIEEIEK
jgi:predicted transposase/invertase (TIGR01784 family)